MQHERLNRRHFLASQTYSLGSVALAWLLQRDGFAAAPAKPSEPAKPAEAPAAAPAVASH